MPVPAHNLAKQAQESISVLEALGFEGGKERLQSRALKVARQAPLAPPDLEAHSCHDPTLVLPLATLRLLLSANQHALVPLGALANTKFAPKFPAGGQFVTWVTT